MRLRRGLVTFIAAIVLAQATASAAPMSAIDSVDVQANVGLVPPYSSFVSPNGGRVYLGVGANPGSAFSLPTNPLALPPLVAQGNSDEAGFLAAVQSPDGQYGYFSAYTVGQPNAAKVVRVRLSDMTRETAAGVGFGQQQIFSAGISPDGRYGYWGTYNQDASFPDGQKVALVKFDLETMSPVSIVNLPNADAYPTSVLISGDGGTAWLGTQNGRVVEVDLTTMTRTGSVDLAAGENQVDSGIMSPDGRYGYFPTGQSPARVVRVDLETMARIDAVTFAAGQNDVSAAAISPDGQYGYFTTDTDPGRVVAVRLSDMTVTDALTLGAQKVFPKTIAVSPDGQFAFISTTFFDVGPPQVYFSSITRLRLAFLNTLIVNKSGSGTVSGSGVDCGTTCSISRLDYQDTGIALTATPSAGQVFKGWSGACSGTGGCSLNLTQAQTVTATFEPAPDPNPNPDPNPVTPSLEVGALKVKVGKKGAYFTSRATVNTAGSLAQVATTGSRKKKTWCRTMTTARTAATYSLKCNLGSKGRRYLKKRSLALTVTTTLRAATGTSATNTRRLKIKRKR